MQIYANMYVHMYITARTAGGARTWRLVSVGFMKRQNTSLINLTYTPVEHDLARNNHNLPREPGSLT